MTEALGEKVKKSNFKEALKRHWEKQCWERQFTSEYYLPSAEPIINHSQQYHSKIQEVSPPLSLTQTEHSLPISELYVERIDIEMLCYKTLLQPDSLIRVTAPQLMGKTSLIERVLAKVTKSLKLDVLLNHLLTFPSRQNHFS